MRAPGEDDLQLVYDGQCPVCRTYCEGVLKETKDRPLVLVDAREKSAVMDEITARKLDIDEGMVLKTGGKLFYGADAIFELARRNQTPGFYGMVNRLFFGNRLLAHIFYPLGKAFRNLVLRIRGIKKIRNLG